MQRRAQEVINFCAMSGEKENLIKSIHDVVQGVCQTPFQN